MSLIRPMLVGCLLLLAAGCTSYDYEEEVFLEVDGSGSIRVSGSVPALRALHEVEPSEALLRAPGMEVVSVRETDREGRPFVHIQATFASFRDLCLAPAFRSRRCRFERDSEELRLFLEIPAPPRSTVEGLDPRGTLAIRYHFPGTIRFHNSRSDIERGNILAWKRSLGEHLDGKPLSIEVRFDRRSLLEASLRILVLSVGLVVASVTLALWLLVRKGKRELAISGYPPRFDHPAGG